MNCFREVFNANSYCKRKKNIMKKNIYTKYLRD